MIHMRNSGTNYVLQKNIKQAPEMERGREGCYLQKDNREGPLGGGGIALRPSKTRQVTGGAKALRFVLEEEQGKELREMVG